MKVISFKVGFYMKYKNDVQIGRGKIINDNQIQRQRKTRTNEFSGEWHYVIFIRGRFTCQGQWYKICHIIAKNCSNCNWGQTDPAENLEIKEDICKLTTNLRTNCTKQSSEYSVKIHIMKLFRLWESW